MTPDANASLVVGISSRALFDLDHENEIFETQGLQAYATYQREHENELLQPGSGFPLVRALLNLNTHFEDHRLVEVIVVSRNSPDMGIRLFKSIEAHQLEITRAAFTSGKSLTPYLSAFQVDLFLSKYDVGVQSAIDAGIAGAVIYDLPDDFDPDSDKIRIAFDGDAVLFRSRESERIFEEQGLEAYDQYEREHAQNPMAEGPFTNLLRTLATLQTHFDPDNPPIRIALVTARSSPAHERVIRTLRAWDLHIDEAFFMGGMPKDAILKAFRPHIFFDDQEANLVRASRVVPSARVPIPTDEESEAPDIQE